MCNSPLGIESRVVANKAMAASSDDGSRHRASDGRLNNAIGYAWCAKVGSVQTSSDVSFNLFTNYIFVHSKLR